MYLSRDLDSLKHNPATFMSCLSSLLRWDDMPHKGELWQAVITAWVWFGFWDSHMNLCSTCDICAKSEEPVSRELATSSLRSLQPTIPRSYQQPHTLLLRWLAAPLTPSQDEWRSRGHLPCDQPQRSCYLRLQSRAACVLQSSAGPRHAE